MPQLNSTETIQRSDILFTSSSANRKQSQKLRALLSNGTIGQKKRQRVREKEYENKVRFGETTNR